MTYVKAALALIAIVNWIMGRVDKAEQAKILKNLWEQKFMKDDEEAIGRAQSARDAITEQLTRDPGRLRAPDPDSRT